MGKSIEDAVLELEIVVAGRRYKWREPREVHKFTEQIDEAIDNIQEVEPAHSEDYLREKLESYVAQVQGIGGKKDYTGPIRGNEHEVISQPRSRRMLKSLPYVVAAGIFAHVGMDLYYGATEVGRFVGDLWLTNGLIDVYKDTRHNIGYGFRENNTPVQITEMSISAWHWWKAQALIFYGGAVALTSLGLYAFGKPARALKRINKHRKEVIPHLSKDLVNSLSKDK